MKVENGMWTFAVHTICSESRTFDFEVNWFKLKTHHPFEKLQWTWTHSMRGFYWRDWKSPAAWAMHVCFDVTAKIYGAWKERKKWEVSIYSTMALWFDDQKCMGLECGIVWKAKSCGKCTKCVQIYIAIRSLQRQFLFRELAHMVLQTHSIWVIWLANFLYFTFKFVFWLSAQYAIFIHFIHPSLDETNKSTKFSERPKIFPIRWKHL